MKDFNRRWGMSYKNIMIMQRQDFCNIHGIRFLNMSYCEFRRTLKKETPNMELMPVGINGYSYKVDRMVNKIEHRACQLSVWDDGEQGWVL